MWGGSQASHGISKKVRQAFTKVLAAGLAVFSAAPMVQNLMPEVGATSVSETVEDVKTVGFAKRKENSGESGKEEDKSNESDKKLENSTELEKEDNNSSKVISNRQKNIIGESSKSKTNKLSAKNKTMLAGLVGIPALLIGAFGIYKYGNQETNRVNAPQPAVNPLQQERNQMSTPRPILSQISSSQNLTYQTIFLGSEKSGKTCLIRRMLYHCFDEDYDQTVAVDYFQKRYVFSDKSTISEKIWDTSSQKEHRDLLSSYLRGSQMCVLTISLDKSEFENSVSELENNSENSFLKIFFNCAPDENVKFIVVMTKGDLAGTKENLDEAKNRIEKAIDTRNDKRIILFPEPVSAQSDTNVEEFEKFMNEKARETITST